MSSNKREILKLTTHRSKLGGIPQFSRRISGHSSLNTATSCGALNPARNETKEYFQVGYDQLINIYSKLQIGNEPLADSIDVEVSTDITAIGNQEEFIFGMLGGMMLTEEEKTIINKLKDSAKKIRLNVEELKRFVSKNDYLLFCSEKFKNDFFKRGYVSDFCGKDILWTPLLDGKILLINPKEFFVRKSEIKFFFNPELTAKRCLEIVFLKEPTIKEVQVIK